MTRRSLIQLLIGVISAIAGLAAMNAFRQDRCLDAGAQWNAATRACVGADGPLALGRSSDVIVAIGIAIVVAFMLYRASTFAGRRSSRPSH